MATRRLLRINEVQAKTGLSRSGVYEAIAAGTFPRAVKIGTRSSAWVESEVDEWIDERVAARGDQDSRETCAA